MDIPPPESLRRYETRFADAVINCLQLAGHSSAAPPEIPCRPILRGSPQSEADAAIYLGSATIILEIDKKGYPADNVVKYHRALTLGLLRPILQAGRLVLVQAFITANIRPLRIENAKYVGELLKRDHGVCYVSAESKTEDIPALVRQIGPLLLAYLATLYGSSAGRGLNLKAR